MPRKYDVPKLKFLQQNIKDKKGKYGRYLGIVYYENENINDWLVNNGLAKIANY